MPVDEPTVAIAVLLLLQEPPGVPSLSGVVWPTHTMVVPVTGLIEVLTVTVVVA